MIFVCCTQVWNPFLRSSLPSSSPSNFYLGVPSFNLPTKGGGLQFADKGGGRRVGLIGSLSDVNLTTWSTRFFVSIVSHLTTGICQQIKHGLNTRIIQNSRSKFADGIRKFVTESNDTEHKIFRSYPITFADGNFPIDKTCLQYYCHTDLLTEFDDTDHKLFHIYRVTFTYSNLPVDKTCLYQEYVF